MRQVLLAAGILMGLSAAAYASPMIGLDDPCPAGNPEIAVNTTNPISLDLTSGGGIFCFYNALTGADSPISDFKIEATTVLNATQLAELSTIACTSDFFTTAECAINYTGDTLSIEYKTTLKDGDEGPFSTDAEIGENEGVPQVLSGCGANQSAISAVGGLPCSTKGYFEINLNGGAETEGNTGDWDTLGVNSFDVTQVNGVAITPEPASWSMLAGFLLLIVGLVRRQAGSRA